MNQYDYTIPIKREIDGYNEQGTETLYRLVDQKRSDAQEMLLLTSLTRCFVGKVCGMQFQLRITPTNRKSSQSSERMASNAEMIVFDSFGKIDDHFISGYHWQYPVDHIKKEMRQKAILRARKEWKVQP